MEVRRAATAICVVAVLAGCGSPKPTGDLTATYHDGGVAVSLTLHDGRLTATYKPDLAGYHLYSAAMPKDGVQGLGRPTVLEPGHGLSAKGPAAANLRPILLHEAALGLDLPVYPDGPVTLTLPVTAAGSPVEAIIGYAACSATNCLAPVADKTVTLR